MIGRLPNTLTTIHRCITGETRFVEAAVIAESPDPVPPCGGCRQKLAEFAEVNARITMATIAGIESEMAVADLLPGAFTLDHMR